MGYRAQGRAGGQSGARAAVANRIPLLLGTGTALLIAAAILLAPAGGRAQSQQATITLRGSVATECSIAISSASATVNLTAGQQSVPVATVQERCNAANGYVVSVSSQNGGRLTSDGGSGVGYSLHYGDTNSAQNGSINTNRTVSGAARSTVLSVSVPASPTLPAGDYQDTVVISITAK